MRLQLVSDRELFRPGRKYFLKELFEDMKEHTHVLGSTALGRGPWRKASSLFTSPLGAFAGVQRRQAEQAAVTHRDTSQDSNSQRLGEEDASGGLCPVHLPGDRCWSL